MPAMSAQANATPLSGARTAIVVLTAMNLLNYVDRYVPSAVKELVKADLQLTDAQTSLPLTSFVWVYMVASPLFGALADKVSRPRLIAGGVLLWSLATAGAAFATDFWSFLFARALVGVGEAAYATLAPPLLSDYYPPARRNAVLTTFYIAIPVGSAIGFGLGGWVGGAYGWQAAFLVSGLPGVLAALAALRVKDPPRGGWDAAPAAAAQPSWKDALQALASNRLYVLAVAGYTAVTFASGALADWFPTHLERSLGMDTGQAGLVVGGTAVVGGLGGTIVGGWLGDKLVGRTRQPYLALSTVSMAVALVFTLGALTLRDSTLVIGSMLLAQFFLWFYNGPVNAIIANSTDAAMRARAFALSILAIHLLGDSISPTLVGWTSDLLGGGAGGLSTALMMVPASMVLGVALWAWGWRRIPDAGPDAGSAA
jgi:MFS family permease